MKWLKERRKYWNVLDQLVVMQCRRVVCFSARMIDSMEVSEAENARGRHTAALSSVSPFPPNLTR
jgi:hypothetical protein